MQPVSQPGTVGMSPETVVKENLEAISFKKFDSLLGNISQMNIKPLKPFSRNSSVHLHL
jgi:hypothetical protein